ncbi:MAG: hypothetical protein A2086_03725 [Spirochaetes bacterium GWD1_27_9]|nr:MAG: hypothetical protein A2Y34_12780 [Spirochaetes bacterium GWC1_27_15]OHD44597.1 MAG: hypothetical protein A2086_03725 [Spirochaetes bacterium GWD1_27_9]
MIIQNNLNFLSKNIIKQLNKIEKNKLDFKLDFKISKDNLFVPIFNNISLHSTYFPLKDGDKVTFSNEKDTICIAIGFGAGYHLVNYCKSGKKIIVIPEDLNLLYLILEKIDLSFFFNNNLKIILKEDILEYFDFFEYKNYFLLIHPISQNIFKEEILDTIKYLKENLNPILLDINTQKKFGKIWQKNILKNILYLFENNFDFSPLFIEKPLLIIGAGPSLDENLTQIKKYRQFFHIASADTAFQILIKHKIIPDSVFTFDAQNYSHLHFVGNNYTFRLFSDFCSPVRLKQIKQTMLFSNHPFINFFKSINFNPVFLPSDSRNIGGSIIDFFKIYFDEVPILTSGIDFAYFKNKNYSNGSYISLYKNINSNYFNTEEQIDANLFYKNNTIKKIDSWSASSLLNEYSNSVNDEVFTISTSPFVNFKKVDSIEQFLKNIPQIKPKKLDFCKPQITKNDFVEAITNYIKKDNSLLLPYFLSCGKKLDEIEINNIIEKIRILFK